MSSKLLAYTALIKPAIENSVAVRMNTVIDTKILCTVRDILSILNSFELILSKNPLRYKSLGENNDNVFSRCESMMDKNGGIVVGPWILLQEGYALNPEMIHFIEYENLCKEPEKDPCPPTK